MTHDAAGVYHIHLDGRFEFSVDGKVPFYKRVGIIFLGQLNVAGATRSSRRTRDGRTPFVRQAQLAEWFEVPQPHISRWNGYWLRQDWRRLLSQKHGEVLTRELPQQVIATWVKFPWWSATRVRQHLREQGLKLTLRQVQQVAQDSGWTVLRQALQQVYHIGKDSFRPRDGWLVQQLLAQVQDLLAQLEAGGQVSLEQRVRIADVQALSASMNLFPAPARQPLPWVLRVEQLLFGQWEAVPDASVRCRHCGSQDVSRKSRQPRYKRYVDPQGQWHTVAVYRYYCHNPACPHPTFTNLPAHLLPHSPYTVAHHLAALQSYVWGHGVYRRTAAWLGLSKPTLYRWVQAFGYGLLPVAALFGVVRSSGVVGVDEKYVLVPKK